VKTGLTLPSFKNDNGGRRGSAVREKALSVRAVAETHIAVIYSLRRGAALGLFGLAAFALRSAMKLFRQGLISTKGVRVVLSATRPLERAAAIVLFGFRRIHRDRSRRGGTGNDHFT
jgi:hypothetical protein